MSRPTTISRFPDLTVAVISSDESEENSGEELPAKFPAAVEDSGEGASSSAGGGLKPTMRGKKSRLSYPVKYKLQVVRRLENGSTCIRHGSAGVFSLILPRVGSITDPRGALELALRED